MFHVCPFVLTFGIIEQLATRIWEVMADVFLANKAKSKESNPQVIISAPHGLPLYSTPSVLMMILFLFFLFVSVSDSLSDTDLFYSSKMIYLIFWGGKLNLLHLVPIFNIVIINNYLLSSNMYIKYHMDRNKNILIHSLCGPMHSEM